MRPSTDLSMPSETVRSLGVEDAVTIRRHVLDTVIGSGSIFGIAISLRSISLHCSISLHSMTSPLVPFHHGLASHLHLLNEDMQRLTGETRMKIKVKFASIFLAACILVFLSLPAFPSPANPPQDQETAETPSVQKGKKQKAERGPGKEIGKGGEDVGKGAGKGAENLGKGTAGAAGNLATLHPGKAGADLGKGAGSAGKDVGVGTGKGAAKIGKGTGKGIGKLGKKVFGRGNKNKKSDD